MTRATTRGERPPPRRAGAAWLLAVAAMLLVIGRGSAGAADAAGPAPLTLSPAERAWLDARRGKLVLAVERGYAPFSFVDAHGRSRGLAHEHLLALEARLGVRFERRTYANLDEAFRAVQAGEAHVLCAVTPTPARAAFLSFTAPYIAVPNVLLVRKRHDGPARLDNLAGKRVSLVRRYAVTEHLLERGPGFEPVLADDDLGALLDVSFGRTDAAVLDLATASYLIEQKGIANLRVASDVGYDIRLAMAAPVGEPVLHGLLDKGLRAIGEEERHRIRARWINISGQRDDEGRLWAVASAASLLFLLGFLAATAWTRALKRQVALRTAELDQLTRSLREQEQLLRTVVDQSPAAIFAHDLEGRCLLTNRAIEHLAGKPASEIVGRTFEEVAPTPLAMVLAAHHAEVLRDGRPTEHEEELPTDDGVKVYISRRVPMRRPDGTIYAVCGVAADITERKRHEKDRQVLLQAEHAARLESEDARRRAEALSDEVRSLYQQLTEVGEAERRSLARDLHDSVGQLLPLAVRRLDEAARVAGGETERTALGEARTLIADALQQTRTLTFVLYPTILDDLGLVPALRWQARSLARDDLEITVDETASLGTVPPALAAYLYRATVELLRNVVKHASARQAMVMLHRENGVVRVLVIDDGRGLEPAQGPSELAAHGLGLFDIRQRARHMGGRLVIKSTPGEGTVAMLEVPDGAGAAPVLRAPRDEEPRPPAPDAPNTPSAHPATA